VFQSKISSGSCLAGFEAPCLLSCIKLGQIQCPSPWWGRNWGSDVTDPYDIILSQGSDRGYLRGATENILAKAHREPHSHIACRARETRPHVDRSCRRARDADTGTGMAIVVQPGRRLCGRGKISRRVRSSQRPEDTRDIKPLAAFLEK
jgi:hypothetical protein